MYYILSRSEGIGEIHTVLVNIMGTFFLFYLQKYTNNCQININLFYYFLFNRLKLFYLIQFFFSRDIQNDMFKFHRCLLLWTTLYIFIGLWGWKVFRKVSGLGQGCVAVRYLTPYFGYIILPDVDWLVQCLAQRKSKRNIQKEKIETDKRRKHFFHTFLYLLGEWTNQRYTRQ